jgi:hypothetical protein
MSYKTMLYCVLTFHFFGVHAMEQQIPENKLHLTELSNDCPPAVIPEEVAKRVFKELISLDYSQTKKISCISTRCYFFVKEYHTLGEQIVVYSREKDGLEKIKMVCKKNPHADINYVSGVPAEYNKLRHYMTALMHAAYLGNVALVEWLINNGADVDKRSRHKHAKHKPYLYPALFFSLHNLQSFKPIEPKIACLAALCKAGADVNQVYGLPKNTILHTATQVSGTIPGLEPTIAFLIDQNANVNQPNILEETPLHKFFGYGHSYLKNEKVLTILMQNGANPHMPNQQDHTAYDLARQLTTSFGSETYIAIMRAHDHVEMNETFNQGTTLCNYYQ